MRITRRSEEFGRLPQQFGREAEFFSVEASANQAQHGARLFNILARAMNRLTARAIPQTLECVLDALAPETPDRFGHGLFSLETKGHGQVRAGLRGKRCRVNASMSGKYSGTVSEDALRFHPGGGRLMEKVLSISQCGAIGRNSLARFWCQGEAMK